MARIYFLENQFRRNKRRYNATDSLSSEQIVKAIKKAKDRDDLIELHIEHDPPI